MSWRDEFQAAVRDFWRFVEPRVCMIMGSPDGPNQIVLTETSGEHMHRRLDLGSAIDGWVYFRDGARAFSSRVQWVDLILGSPRTHTIRIARDSGARTEMQKLRDAVAQDLALPHLYCHAYIYGSRDHPVEFANVGVVRTKDLLSCIDHGGQRRTSNAWFAYVDWDRMREFGASVHEIPPWIGPNTPDADKPSLRPDLYSSMAGRMRPRHCATCGDPIASLRPDHGLPARCAQCGQSIVWLRVRPSAKLVACNPGSALPHDAICLKQRDDDPEES